MSDTNELPACWIISKRRPGFTSLGTAIGRATQAVNLEPIEEERRERNQKVYGERQRRVRILAQTFWQTGRVDYEAPDRREGDDGLLFCDCCGCPIDLALDRYIDVAAGEVRHGRWVCFSCVKGGVNGPGAVAEGEEAGAGFVGRGGRLQDVAVADADARLPGEDRGVA